MERPAHSMSNLFCQLGQASDETAIDHFIAMHRPLAGTVRLHEATFWTPAQASFLRDAIIDDADWAEIVEELNSALHAPHVQH